MDPDARRPRRGKLRVLVVDDSAVVRQIMGAILAKEPDLEVAVAADPLIAMRKMERARPDVILLDLEMPRMDGLTFLRKVMAENPIPVVICSAGAQQGSEAALRALDEGAVELVTKPSVGVADFLQRSAMSLIDAIHAAASARLRPRGLPSRSEKPGIRRLPVAPASDSAATATDVVVAMGASTGGPQALRVLLEVLPPTSPGLLIVQHMPAEFTCAFARRLDAECRIEVREAAEGDAVLRGLALIAPGDQHMVLLRSGARYCVALNRGPRVARHRPSVDVLFRSVARTAGGKAIGVILTGMGSDGAKGLAEMRTAGATTIAQSEKSCVAFGMPGRAISDGAVDRVLPLEAVADAILGDGRTA